MQLHLVPISSLDPASYWNHFVVRVQDRIVITLRLNIIFGSPSLGLPGPDRPIAALYSWRLGVADARRQRSGSRVRPRSGSSLLGLYTDWPCDPHLRSPFRCILCTLRLCIDRLYTQWPCDPHLRSQFRSILCTLRLCIDRLYTDFRKNSVRPSAGQRYCTQISSVHGHILISGRQKCVQAEEIRSGCTLISEKTVYDLLPVSGTVHRSACL